MIPRPKHFVDRFDPVMPGLQRKVAEENRTKGEIVLATDGGSAGDCFDERVASAGIACAGQRYGSIVPGLDQSAYAAEVWALWTAMRNLRTVTGRITVLIDNMSVRNQAAAWAMGLRDRLGIMPSTWRKIRDEITRHKGRIDFVWVPSHGKREEWRAPRLEDTQRFRELKDMADKEATEHLRERLAVTKRRQSLKMRADGRASETLKRMREGSRNMMENHFDEVVWRRNAGQRPRAPSWQNAAAPAAPERSSRR